MKTLMIMSKGNCRDDKIVEKDKEDDGLEDEDILNGKAHGIKLSHKLSKSAKKKNRKLPQTSRGNVLFDCIVWNGYYIAAIIVFQYMYRVTSPRYKNMWKHTDL